MVISCRNCGQLREPYEGSSWCVPCVNMELTLQSIDDTNVIEPEFGASIEEVYA